MTDQPGVSLGDAGYRLSAARGLVRQVRQAQRGGWFPLLLLAAVTAGAIPVDRYGHYSHACTTGLAGLGQVCTRYSTASLWYWPVALVLAAGVAGWFYVRRCRRRGVGTPARPYVVAGAVFALLVTGVSAWAARHPLVPAQVLGFHVAPGSPLAALGYRLATPASAAGLALLPLARLEHSWALAAATLTYMVVALVPVGSGWAVARVSPWSFLPQLVTDTGVLLAGAACVGLAQRAARRGAP
jgi:hypothetical protein